jgi:hypothetical protein
MLPGLVRGGGAGPAPGRSPPRSMSSSVTSGRNRSACWSASVLVDATPTTVMPWRSRRPRAASRNRGLSSTMRQRIMASGSQRDCRCAFPLAGTSRDARGAVCPRPRGWGVAARFGIPAGWTDAAWYDSRYCSTARHRLPIGDLLRAGPVMACLPQRFTLRRWRVFDASAQICSPAGWNLGCLLAATGDNRSRPPSPLAADAVTRLRGLDRSSPAVEKGSEVLGEPLDHLLPACRQGGEVGDDNLAARLRGLALGRGGPVARRRPIRSRDREPSW